MNYRQEFIGCIEARLQSPKKNFFHMAATSCCMLHNHNESYVSMQYLDPISIRGKFKNIGFDGYIGTWILRIYRIYRWIFLHEYQYIGN